MYQKQNAAETSKALRCSSSDRPQHPPIPRSTLLRVRWLGFAVSLIAAASLLASAASGQVIANNTPKFVATAQNLGPVNPSQVIAISVWLNLQNRSELDSKVQELYDHNSPNYHHWLQPEEIAAKFAPTAKDVQTVEQFLTSNNLQVVTVGPDGFFVQAQGTVAAVGKGFHVQINNYDVNGKTYRANTNDPYIEGPAAAVVRSVSGLDNQEYEHPLVTRSVNNPAPTSNSESAISAAEPEFFTTDCFNGVKTEHYTTGGTFPTATYTGNNYYSSPIAPGCGYTPPEIQTAYNLTALYNEGYNGSGQTIVIVDWCGSLTIQSDANAFSAKFGLQQLTSSNFQIINYPGPSQCAGEDPEINIDVEWSHAIAPGANIDLLVPPTSSFQDVDNAELYAVTRNLGKVMSCSFGSEEFYTETKQLDTANLINEMAAAQGISVNYASGDEGDYTFDIPGFQPSVSAPADSPYGTAVGGVSLALNSSNGIAWQTGWGTNLNDLTGGGAIFNPPTDQFFDFGSGGGSSGVFAKPAFQSNLPGTFRQLPDISWLADPYTGAVIAIGAPLQFPPQVWQAYGGTSVACPMFSGLWAIANQEAGTPLGQAAALLYSMPGGTITDVVPYSSATDVTATISSSSTQTTQYTAADLSAPLESTTTFFSALWDYPFEPNTTILITFGTDSNLNTTTGWDNVTGLGTPNGKPFADFFHPAPQP
jgi:subtilase family serine protease